MKTNKNKLSFGENRKFYKGVILNKYNLNLIVESGLKWEKKK